MGDELVQLIDPKAPVRLKRRANAGAKTIDAVATSRRFMLGRFSVIFRMISSAS